MVQEPRWNDNGVLVNPMSTVAMTNLLDACIVKNRVVPFLSLEMRHPNVPDGAIVLRAYPFGKKHKFFGKNPQVNVQTHWMFFFPYALVIGSDT
jgi:hypothetical protein